VGGCAGVDERCGEERVEGEACEGGGGGQATAVGAVAKKEEE
jgi:hypothetical protein